MKNDTGALQYNGTAYGIAAAGEVLLFALYPFIMLNGYVNITGVRFLFFSLSAAAVFVCCCAAAVWQTPRLKPRKPRFSASDIAWLAFFACLTLSAVLSPFGAAAVTGSEGRFMGLLIYIAAFAAYFWLSRFCVLSERTLLLLSGAAACVVLFALLQFEGADIFGLLKKVKFEDRKNFLSPLGNINVYSAYLSAAVPPAMYMSCFAKRKKARPVFLGLSSAGFIGLFTANSDSGYLAFGTAFLILFVLCCAGHAALRRFAALADAFFVSALLFALLNRIVNGTRGLSYLTQLLTETPAAAVGAAICTGALLLLKKRTLSPKTLRSVRLAVILLSAAAVAAALGLVLWFSLSPAAGDPGYFSKYLRFDDSWGTDRGYLWRRLIRCFASAGWKEKLFGFGEDTVAPVLMKSYADEMLSELGYLFDNAHNEVLQYLLTTGLCGAVSYLTLIFITVKTGFSSGAPVEKRALALAAAAYFVQSLFNILQPISSPFIFLLTGLIACSHYTAIQAGTETDTVPSHLKGGECAP